MGFLDFPDFPASADKSDIRVPIYGRVYFERIFDATRGSECLPRRAPEFYCLVIRIGSSRLLRKGVDEKALDVRVSHRLHSL